MGDGENRFCLFYIAISTSIKLFSVIIRKMIINSNILCYFLQFLRLKIQHFTL
jgi:hypothetical protein